MKLPRRRFLHLALGAAALPAFPRFATAQAYPSRPVRSIVGFAPGGAADIVARLIGQWLSERLGQPFVVENRPGAATNIALQAAASSKPDGYTLVSLTSTNASNATLYGSLSFNLRATSFRSPVIPEVPLVLEVNPRRCRLGRLPSSSRTPRPIQRRSALRPLESGSSSHLAQELFRLMAGVTVIHVPYRGDAPALTDVISGQVQVNVQHGNGFVA